MSKPSPHAFARTELAQIAVVTAAVAIVAFFLVSVGEPLTTVDALLASSIIVLLLFYGARYLLGDTSYFPFLSYALLHFSVFFALPALWPTTTIRGWPSHQPYYSIALLLVVACCFAIIAGHAFARKYFAKVAFRLTELMPKVSTATRKTPSLVFALLVVSTVVGGLSNLAIGTNLLGPVSFLVVSLFNPYFLFAILIYLHYEDRGPGSRLYVILAFLVLLAFGIFAAQIHAILKPFIIVFVGRLILRKKVIWSFVIFAVLAFVILNPIKNEYRRILRAGGDVSVEVVVDAWSSAWTENEDRRTNPISIATQSRLNELVYLANIVEVMPEKVDFQYGYPWRTILQLYVPGFLWPDKPDLRRAYATEWGVQMSYIEPFQHKKLALNLPLPVDGYWNFGVFGVVFVGIIIGMVIGFIERIAITNNCMTFSLGMAFFVSIHANNRLGISIADLPVVFLLLCLLVVGLNLLTSMPAVAGQKSRASP